MNLQGIWFVLARTVAPMVLLFGAGSALAFGSDTRDGDGVDLSDHRGVAVNWRYSAATNRKLSDQFGGLDGNSFNDVSLLPANPAVRELKIRTGKRVDQVEIVLSNGYPFRHGGWGGDERTLTLQGGEYLTSVDLCTGKHNNTERVFHAQFHTSAGRSLGGGTTTSECATYSAPSGWQIVAFHGRSADEVDKLGVVYAPVTETLPGATPMQFVNRRSGQCLDLNQAKTADGTNVIQWSCNGGVNQHWSYDDTSGLIRNMQDPTASITPVTSAMAPISGSGVATATATSASNTTRPPARSPCATSRNRLSMPLARMPVPMSSPGVSGAVATSFGTWCLEHGYRFSLQSNHDERRTLPGPLDGKHSGKRAPELTLGESL